MFKLLKQRKKIPEFFTARILTPRNTPSHQHQNLSTQVSQDNKLPMVEQTPGNQNLDANTSINRLADAFAGSATQQRPQAATMLKPIATNTFFMAKTRNLNCLKPISHNAQNATENDGSHENQPFYEKKHFKRLEIEVHQTRKLSMTS